VSVTVWGCKLLPLYTSIFLLDRVLQNLQLSSLVISKKSEPDLLLLYLSRSMMFSVTVWRGNSLSYTSTLVSVLVSQNSTINHLPFSTERVNGRIFCLWYSLKSNQCNNHPKLIISFYRCRSFNVCAIFSKLHPILFASSNKN